MRPFDVYRGEQVGQGRKSIAFAVSFQSPERTLSDEDAAGLLVPAGQPDGPAEEVGQRCERLALAQNEGQITLTLRNPLDSGATGYIVGGISSSRRSR